jgi:two-component system sensor histidine kinase UhpB
LNIGPVEYQRAFWAKEIIALLCAAIIFSAYFVMGGPTADASDTPEGADDNAAPAPAVSLTARERAWLARNPTVRVGLGEYPPTMSVKDGRPFGIAIDFLEQVALRTGIRFRYDGGTVPFSERLKGIMAHAGPDLLPSLQRTPAREKQILFTDAYLTNPRFIFTRDDAPFVASLAELSGRTVAVEQGFLVQKWLAEGYPAIRRLGFPSTKAALEAVSSGKSAAYVGPLRATAAMINQFGFSNLKAAAPSGLPDGIVRMGIRSDWPELQGMINKVLGAMPPEEKAAIVNRWTTVRFEHGIRPGDVLKWLLLSVGAGAGIVLWFVFWNRMLRRQVQERTADLAAANQTLADEIDEHRAAEKALAEKEAQELALINAVRSPFFMIHPDGTLIVANQALADQFGRDITRLAGANVYDLIPESIAQSRRVQVGKAVAAGRAMTFTDLRSGRYVENRLYPLKDARGTVTAVAVLAADITEKVEAEQMIAESEARFRATFEQAAVGIAHVGTDGRFLRINRKFCSIVGYPAGELLERTFQEITHPEDLDTDLDQVRQLLAGEKDTYSLEKRYVRKDGGTVWVNLTVSLVRDETGAPQNFVSVIEDISRRKQAEAKIREYQARLKAMTSQLTLAEEKERRAIAADLHDHVGHSLALARMQLSAIPASTSALEINLLVKDISNILLKALQETRSLMFELSSPSMNEIGLSAAISEWLEDHIGKRHDLKTAFVEHIADDRHMTLDADVRAMLFRNVRELLANVVKHARADSVRVCLTCDAAGVIIIVVEDDGVGFDPADVDIKMREDVGFGLFSIQERMADLGGAFEIQSAPGRGARATLTLPAAPLEDTE